MNVLSLFAIAMLITTSLAPKITTSEELIRSMHDRYANSWYKTLTFVQKTTTYKPDGTSSAETWYEYMSLPGKLRIDIDPVKEGNSILFANDTQYTIKGGKVSSSQPRVHSLLLLGFDVYALKPEETLAKLKQLGFDLSVMHEDTWQGRPVYVVGAQSGDLRSRQFWIDKEYLYFVRLLQPNRDGSKIQETQFNKYVRMGKGWVSAEVLFMTGGKPTTKEEYSDLKIDVNLDNKMFEPSN
ncbi:MAG TPA: hypothetical protein VFC63_20105 [Blastocatellia bacterium]|nr:hypothetical protein [Blastocatellia bacterium]